MTRVLAFTCSRYRPLFIRHTVMQMQNQTHPVDHAIYLNAEGGTPSGLNNYIPLIEDASSAAKDKIFLAYGPSLSQHRNHLAAIGLAPWEKYDLFLKVDDDDIYLKDYVEKVVKDFEQNHWDFSGSFAESQINGKNYYKDQALRGLGLQQPDKDLGIPPMMGGTFAFSLKAIRFLKSLPDSTVWEDITWRRSIVANPELKFHLRENSSYIYNIHGENVSTAHCFKND